MDTVHQPPDTGEADGPHITPYFLLAVERASARLFSRLPETAA